MNKIFYLWGLWRVFPRGTVSQRKSWWWLTLIQQCLLSSHNIHLKFTFFTSWRALPSPPAFPFANGMGSFSSQDVSPCVLLALSLAPAQWRPAAEACREAGTISDDFKPPGPEDSLYWSVGESLTTAGWWPVYHGADNGLNIQNTSS